MLSRVHVNAKTQVSHFHVSRSIKRLVIRRLMAADEDDGDVMMRRLRLMLEAACYVISCRLQALMIDELYKIHYYLLLP